MSLADSADTFDFMLLLDPNEPQLLSESFTLESLSQITSDEIVPPFPVKPIVTIPPLILYSHSPMFPPELCIPEDENLTVIVSVPTFPRLTRLLHESLCVTRWVENNLGSDSPGDIPWGGIRPTRAEVWRAAGSLYSPCDFKKALISARKPRPPRLGLRPLVTFGSLQSKAGSPPVLDQSSFRKALVFKREITLNTGGKPKRWSLQVPATTMDPEMVDMMLELQDLNSFFKHGLEDVEQFVVVLNQEKDKIHPPSLMVSDSHHVLPLSLESSEHVIPDTSLPLATRRGKDLLPPISIKSLDTSIAETSYPSIPSAFMGSPSAYSPKFEYGNGENGISLGLEDMITSLKSQCVYPQSASYTDPEFVDSPMSAISFASPSDQTNGDGDGDDWAFAVSLLTEFGSQPSEILGKIDHISPGSALSPQTLLTGAGLLTPSENSGIPTAIAPRGHHIRDSILSPSNPAPTTQLPSTPSPASADRTSSPKSVRGILKSCKNVRFASLPEKPEDPADVKSLTSTPRTPLGPSTPPYLQRPLRMRTIYRTSKQIPESPSTPVTPQCFALMPSSPRPVKVDEMEKDRSASTRPPSTLIDQSLGKNLGSAIGVNSRSRPSTARHSHSSAQKSVSPGRTKPDGDKENEMKTSTPRAAATSRWTMNDMTFRRGSSASQSPEGTPRSRMPVPLRNILTRFK